MFRRVQCVLSLIMLISKDIYVLINICSFAESIFLALSVVSLFVLRWRRPDMHRPIKVYSYVLCVTHDQEWFHHSGGPISM